MAKRESGEGTYYTEGNLFCWRLRDRNGVVVATVKRKTAALRKAAVKAKLKEIEGAGGHALPKQRAHTVESYLNWWLQNIVCMRSKATQRQYGQCVRLYIVPHLGKLSLSRLASKDVLEWQAAFLLQRKANGKPYAPRTRGLALVTLKAALADAREQVPPLITINPAASIEEPRASHITKRALRPEGIDRMMSHAGESRYGPMVVLLITTGASVSEASGWMWSDFDPDAKPRAVLRILRKLEWGPAPKDANGKRCGPAPWSFEEVKRTVRRRAVPLGRLAIEALDQIRAEQERLKAKSGDDWPDHGLIFTTETGAPVIPRNLQRALTQLRVRAGLPHLSLHDLRKTFATHLARHNTPVDTLRTLMGHSLIQTTQKHYLEVLPNDAALAAAIFD